MNWLNRLSLAAITSKTIYETSIQLLLSPAVTFQLRIQKTTILS